MLEVARIGFIGCGGMARTHMKIIQRYVPQFKIRGFMDVNQDKAKNAWKDFSGDYYTTDLDRLLNDPEVDAVYICTHHDTHLPIGVKAAEAGKDIFMEKPLALTIKECEKMEEAVEETGIKFMVGFTQRFSALSQKAKELVSDPTVTWGRQIQAKWADTSWAQDSKEGGGNVLSTGCHTIDLLCWFNPSKPVEIHAEGGTIRHTRREVIDTTVAVIRFENGAVAAAIIADCGPAGLPMMAYELLGEGHGAFILNWQELWFNSPLQGLARRMEIDLRILEGTVWDYGLIQENEAFADYVLGGGPSPVPVEDGTRATLLILRAFESIRTGKTQAINL